MKKILNNKFKSTSTFAPPFEMKPLRQWLNTEHTGKSSVPLDVQCSEELKESHYRVGGHREVTIHFKINKKGDWDIELLEYWGKKYSLIEVK